MLDKTDTELAEKLKDFRYDKELTWDDLSAIFKLSASTLWRFVNGRHKPNDITRKRIKEKLSQLNGGVS